MRAESMLAELVQQACVDADAAACLPRRLQEGLSTKLFPYQAVISAVIKPLGSLQSPPPSMWPYCRRACDLLSELLCIASPEQHHVALQIALFLIHVNADPPAPTNTASRGPDDPARKRARLERLPALSLMHEAAAKLLWLLVGAELSHHTPPRSPKYITGYEAIQELIAARYRARRAAIAANAAAPSQAAPAAAPVGALAAVQVPIEGGGSSARGSLPLSVSGVVDKLNERRSVLSLLLCGSATQPPPRRDGTLHWAAMCLASVAHANGSPTTFALAGHPIPAVNSVLFPAADLRTGQAWGSMVRYMVRLLQLWAPCHAIHAVCEMFSKANGLSSSLGRSLLLEAMVKRIKEVCARTITDIKTTPDSKTQCSASMEATPDAIMPSTMQVYAGGDLSSLSYAAPNLSLPPPHKPAREMAPGDELEKEDLRAIAELSSPFWQEWFALCDHAMSLALNRILDIVALVRALQAQNVKHNLVDAPVSMVATDVSERERTLYLRDGAASCIYCEPPSSPHPNRGSLQASTHHSGESYAWWNTLRETSRPANATPSSVGAILGSAHAIRRVCLLSHMTSQPFAEILVEAVVTGRQSKLPRLSFPPLPGNSQQQPLPLALLAHISLQSRLRVVAAIEEMLLQQQLPAPKLRAHDGWAIELYPPSHVMLETYARLLLTAPGTLVRKQRHLGGTLVRKQVIERLREKEAPVGFKEKFSIHALQASVTLLELCCYRLAWILKRNNLTREIVDVAAELLFTTSSMQAPLPCALSIPHSPPSSTAYPLHLGLASSLSPLSAFPVYLAATALIHHIALLASSSTCLKALGAALNYKTVLNVEAAARSACEQARVGMWPPESHSLGLTADSIASICKNLIAVVRSPLLLPPLTRHQLAVIAPGMLRHSKITPPRLM
ncbi:MAG: hypothetical protein SGPRY_000967 [Prymnesium sp.]